MDDQNRPAIVLGNIAGAAVSFLCLAILPQFGSPLQLALVCGTGLLVQLVTVVLLVHGQYRKEFIPTPGQEYVRFFIHSLIRW